MGTKLMSNETQSLAGKVALQGRPTAYVCRLGACEAPTGDHRIETRHQLG